MNLPPGFKRHDYFAIFALDYSGKNVTNALNVSCQTLPHPHLSRGHHHPETGMFHSQAYF